MDEIINSCYNKERQKKGVYPVIISDYSNKHLMNVIYLRKAALYGVNRGCRLHF